MRKIKFVSRLHQVFKFSEQNISNGIILIQACILQGGPRVLTISHLYGVLEERRSLLGTLLGATSSPLQIYKYANCFSFWPFWGL
jgi:hypothetical protein